MRSRPVAVAPTSSARSIARYLIGLRPVLTDACATRNDWVRGLGQLIGQAQTGDVGKVARGSGQLGRDFGERFRNTRSRIELLAPPPECDLCHASVRGWTHALLGSCEALGEVGRSGQLHGLRMAQEKLADARIQAHRFNDEYARLSQDLRRRVASARRRNDRLPTSRQASPS